MIKHKVFEVTPCNKVPKDAMVLTSTWAMKKKANGTHRACLNVRGFEQIDGEHYDEDSKFAPVVSEVMICVILNLFLMAGWHAELLDVKGAFLHGKFKKG